MTCCLAVIFLMLSNLLLTVLSAFVAALGADGESVQSSYKASHQQACKAWEIPATFPDHKVLEAYAKPSVDTNKTAFTFLKPDLEILRGYCQKSFGWSQVRDGDAFHKCSVQTDLTTVPLFQRSDDFLEQAFWRILCRIPQIACWCLCSKNMINGSHNCVWMHSIR